MANEAFILTAVTLLIAALMWCLIGFTRALKEPPILIGLLVRLQKHCPDSAKKQAVILDFRTSQLSDSRLLDKITTPVQREQGQALRLGRKG